MENYICNVCDNTNNNKIYEGREMMFGMKDLFTYFKCANCGCLQIKSIPEKMDKYYPENYYSFNEVRQTTLKSKIVIFLMKHAFCLRFGRIDFIGIFAIIYNRYYKNVHPWLKKEFCVMDSKILDIGCGNGFLLNEMKLLGFSNLIGLDPYIKQSTITANGVKIIKDEIFNLHEKFDFIMLHHSFEHMTDPRKTFKALANIVSDKGYILIRIPLTDSYAWRKYKMDWFQVDAPRHFFLHTIKSITLLAELADLEIENIVFDSTYSQFFFSEKYLQNITFLDKSNKNLDPYLRSFEKKSKELNDCMDGDQACFYLKKRLH